MLGETCVPEYPQEPVNFLHNTLFLGEDRDGARRAVDDCQGRREGDLRDVNVRRGRPAEDLN